jgi:hypothetical protein
MSSAPSRSRPSFSADFLGEFGDLFFPQAVADRIEHVGELLPDLAQPELARVGGDVIEARVVVFQKDAVVDGRREDRLHAIEIALRDRVELVVVAARATDGQSEEDLRGGVDVVGELLDTVEILDLEQHVAIGSDAVVAGAGAGLGVARE